MRIGFVGIGRMGEPMARSLARAGHQVPAYNRTRARAERLAGDGVRVAGSAAEAARGAEAVVTMLPDDAAVEAVALGPGGLCEALPPRAPHVSMSTIGVALTRRLAAAHRERGQAMVAAPVFGRPEAADAGKLFVIAAGEREALARCEPLFAAVGQRSFVLGADPAAAAAVKLAGNCMLQSAVASMAEAFALARRCGVDPAQFLEVLTGTVFTAPLYRAYGGMIAADRYEPPGFALALGLKDVRLALAAAAEAGVPMPVAGAVRDQLDAGVERGYGPLDVAALGRVAADDAGL